MATGDGAANGGTCELLRGSPPMRRKDAVSADEFCHVYRTEYPRLVRLAWLLGNGDNSEDVVQEAFVRVYARAPRLPDADSLIAYLRVAVLNVSRSHRRRLHMVWAHAARQAPPQGEASRESSVDDRLALVATLGALPRRQREAVLLRYYVDLGEHETAELMGITVGAVKSYASRGLAALKPIIGGLR